MADVAITAASVVPGANAVYRDGIAGATITAGQVCYVDATDGRVKLADANASATTANPVGIAVNGASSGQPVRLVVEDDDFTIGGTVAKGVYVLSATAGGIAPVADVTTGWYPVVVGVAISTSKVVVKFVRGTAAV